MSELQQRRCVHLADDPAGDELARHSTITFTTVEPRDNTTSYEWHLQVKLCVLCSGFVRGALACVMAPG